MTQAGTNTEEIRVPVSEQQTVTVLRDVPASGHYDWLVIYAPGAGSNIHDPFGARLCRSLTDQGFATVRLQFPYMEEKRGRPDRPKVLETTWRQVIDAVRQQGTRLAIGGRSMGGRIASHIAAEDGGIDALALFAYPLRPPNNPSTPRDAHFGKISVPALFCSGTRDSFGTPDDLASAVARIPGSKLHLLDGADHGFAVPKSTGRTREEVWNEGIAVFIEWLRSL